MSDPRPADSPVVCYRHPDRPTVLACSSCGRPICPECSTDASVGQKCPECLRAEGTQRVVNVRAGWTGPLRRRAPLTFWIIVVTVGIAALEYLSPGLYNDLFNALAMSNVLVGRGELWRLVTVVLLHSGVMHVGFNMYALYVLGPQLERELGSIRFVALYVSTAVVGSAFAFHLGAHGVVPGGPGDVAVGASGAIFGLFGVWMASAFRLRRTRGGRMMLNQLLLLLAINAAIPLFVPQVSWQAHLGGLLSGFVMGLAFASIRGRSAIARHVAVALALAAAAVISIPLFG